MSDAKDILVKAAIEAIDNLQFRHGKLEAASRHLATHISKRPAVERSAFARLSVGEKPPTKTWIEANMDLDADFAAWRETRNQYEADLLVEQGKTRVADLGAQLAVALVSA